jgi:uncharacterized protein YbjT (DUF2867 family)
MENLKTQQWVLVTDGTGFVGAHAILQLLQKGYNVKTDHSQYKQSSKPTATPATPKRVKCWTGRQLQPTKKPLWQPYKV